jgi:hypothetical protein
VKFYQERTQKKKKKKKKKKKNKKKTIGTSFGPDHTLKRFEAILARLVLPKKKSVCRGNLHVCHFVPFGRIEQKFIIEFRNDLRL